MRKRLVVWTAVLVSAGATAFGQVNEGQPRPTPNPKKSDAPNAGGEAYDPLAFYRRNPELMKRYFPQLYAAGGGQPARAAGGEAPPAAPEPAMSSAMVIPSIKFGGGSADDLVHSLKNNLPTAPNIMVAEKTAGTTIPPFELQNVTLADLFQALNNLSEDKSAQWQLSGSSEPIWVLNSVANGQFGGFPVGPAVDPLTGRPLSDKESNRNCQVLPVGKYLIKYKIEDITTAVKTAWSMTGQENGAQLKYHKDTELLIVVGSVEQNSIVNQVLNSLDIGMRDNAKRSNVGESGKQETAEPEKKLVR